MSYASNSDWSVASRKKLSVGVDLVRKQPVPRNLPRGDSAIGSETVKDNPRDGVEVL